MIYFSYEWKQELARIKNRIIKNISKEEHKDRDFFYIERDIFLSAFIIRKLIESNKLSDFIDHYNLKEIAYKPVKHINRLHCYIDEDEYNWKEKIEKVITDEIVQSHMIYKEDIDDYKSVQKKRGDL